MSQVVTAPARLPAPRAPMVVVAGVLALLTGATLLLRTGIIGSGYWVDEAIAVGIASHHFADIPHALLQDGSPPLFYLLLHVWMGLVGASESATRVLSLLFAALAVPVSWWAGTAVFDRRAGALAAAFAAGCPFLTYYAQETRMYSLVVVLSVLACASFVLAFLHGSRRHLVLLGVWLTLLLYTHNWALFLAAGMAVAWLWLWRAGRVDGREGVLLAAAVALLYAPWIPSIVSQASNTAAPWAQRPGALQLLGIPGALFGTVAGPLLAVAVVGALRRRRMAEEVRVLAVIAIAASAIAFASSQVQPAWASRYLAVLFGPLLLALASTLSKGTRWTAAALASVAAIWLVSAPSAVKSNARTVAATVAHEIRPGDLVVSTQPEQVPVLDRYLPAGVLFLTPLGTVPDPGVTDWRDGVARLHAGQADRVLAPLVDQLAPGRRVLLVMPVHKRVPSQAPWNRAVRVRTREWRGWLRADRRLRLVGQAPRSTFPPRRSMVRTQLFEVR